MLQINDDRKIEFGLNYIEGLALSLVQEYLYRKGLKITLKALNGESELQVEKSRLLKAEEIGLEPIMRINKKSPNPLKSILEVLLNSIINTSTNVIEKSPIEIGRRTRKYSTDKQLNQCHTDQHNNNQYTFHHDHHFSYFVSAKDNKSEKVAQSILPAMAKSKISEETESKISLGSHNQVSQVKVGGESKNSISTTSIGIKNKQSIQQSDLNSRPNRGPTDRGNFERNKMEDYPISASSNTTIKSNWFQSNNQNSSNYNETEIKNSNNETIEKISENDQIFSTLNSKIDKNEKQIFKTEKVISICNNISLNDIQFEDLEFEEIRKKEEGSYYSNDLRFEQFSNPSTGGNKNFVQNTFKKKSTITRIISAKEWKVLKNCILGGNSSFSDGWLRQGFHFDRNIPCGIVQNKGGPCGVLAVVQALIFRNLIFHEKITDINTLMDHRSVFKKRDKALEKSILEILQKCGRRKRSDSEVSFQVSVLFSSIDPGDEYRVFEDIDELEDYIRENLESLDCVGLVYSAILSRGIDKIQNDMDFANSPLLGQHGYCTQELVNLLLIGKAISNVFDKEIRLDDKVLKGMESQCDIVVISILINLTEFSFILSFNFTSKIRQFGKKNFILSYLSLFEHYNSCQVGLFLKCPKYPIWIICSESHFSLLFSTQMIEKYQNQFDLLYYDGLSRQKKLIKLTISLQENYLLDENDQWTLLELTSTKSTNNFKSNDPRNLTDEELIPPLEKCIRTKWKFCSVDWNDSEPIL